MVSVINGYKPKIFSCAKALFFSIWVEYLVFKGLWCHLYSKHFFYNVQITVLEAKQYKFFHRLRYLLRWLAGNTARTFLCFEMDLIHIRRPLKFWNNVFKPYFQNRDFPWLRKKHSDFLRLKDFECGIEFFSKWMIISTRVN